MTDKFEELCAIARSDQYLQSSLALLEWDQQTKLPSAGGAYRADQITFLAGEIHKRQTSNQRGDLISQLAASEAAADQHSDTGATIAHLKRDYEKKTKKPQALVEALARACSVGQQVWIEARAENDFQKFAPNLQEIFKLKREEADAVGYQSNPYDALLDDYEPGAKTSEVEMVLSNLKDELVPLIAAIADSSVEVDDSLLRREFSVADQEAFCLEASAKIGFDFDRGRLDVTHHPFCTEMGPDDVRITTRFDPRFFSSAFFGTLHEAGHGIYEQGLRSEFYGLAPGQYCSLGIHESQSRLWENLVGRSREFWQHFYPAAQSRFSSLKDVPQEDFYAAINRVAPSLIRVEADEATYNLHIIIRFELEQELLKGDLAVADLPSAWNSRYQQYLGIQPDSDANGVMQDIHWSAGLVGYFPTYSLGNLYASQFFEKAEQDLGDLHTMFASGEFEPLKKWLNENVHRSGRRFRSEELGQHVTGQPISHDPLIRHLRGKLEPIY